MKKILPLTLFLLPAGASTAGEIRATPATLAAANAKAGPGVTIVLAAGTYKTPIRPARSGAAGKPVIYKAARGAKPLFTGIPVAVDVRERSHITVAGITARDVGRFAIAENSAHILDWVGPRKANRIRQKK